MIHHGDCLDVMAAMEPESVDAVVTDPPYDLTDVGRKFQGSGGTLRPDGGPRSERRGGGFMGKTWDGTGIAFRPETWAAALRVAKPSAYLLAFGGTRTVHRMATAIEDAGWIIRDMLVWAYASGFPKSKASLKPAWEPIVMARKPGPLRMLAIDECRIPHDEPPGAPSAGMSGRTGGGIMGPAMYRERETTAACPAGRWPANILLTDPIFDGGWDGVVGGGAVASRYEAPSARPRRLSGYRDEPAGGTPMSDAPDNYGDEGTYSRFFLVPKASRSDREPVLTPDWFEGTGRVSTHPTVKPTELMRHLVRLVTPAGGLVLDPFLGSGSTGIAAELEGFPWIGVEKEAEYCAIAEARLNGTQRGMGLVG